MQVERLLCSRSLKLAERCVDFCYVNLDPSPVPTHALLIEGVGTFVYSLYGYAADPAGKTTMIFLIVYAACSRRRPRDKGGREVSVQNWYAFNFHSFVLT